MRCFRYAVLLLAFALIGVAVSGCSSGVPEAETVIKDGRLYRIGDKKPFTGVLTGYDTVHGHPAQRFRKGYVKGVQEGHAYYYYPNGNLACREYYRDGKANGIASYFYESGKIKAHVHLEDDLRGGEHGEAFYLEDETHFSFFKSKKQG